MSAKQKEQLRQHLWRVRMNNAPPISFAHGCCIGADIDAHEVAAGILGPLAELRVYPSTAKTAAPIPEDANYIHKRMPPLVRNWMIVQDGRDLLLAAPQDLEDPGYSGTWHAIRYAKRIGVPYIILGLDVDVSE